MPDTKYVPVTVTERRDWLPGKLFSLRTTRPEGYAFEAGQFARLGLPEAARLHEGEAEPTIWRAYSMVSGPAEPWLEFYSVVVPGGEFSPLLARLEPGERLYLDRTAFGFLTLARFTPAADLWLIGSGTGLSAYLSMLREAAPWRDYRRIVLVHGVRTAAELAYRQSLEAPAFPGMAPGQLVYLPVASREPLPGKPAARLTTLLADGRLEALAGVPLDPQHSRVMLCGNPEMVADARKLLGERGFAPGRRGVPGNLAVENYW